MITCDCVNLSTPQIGQVTRRNALVVTVYGLPAREPPRNTHRRQRESSAVSSDRSSSIAADGPRCCDNIQWKITFSAPRPSACFSNNLCFSSRKYSGSCLRREQAQCHPSLIWPPYNLSLAHPLPGKAPSAQQCVLLASNDAIQSDPGILRLLLSTSPYFFAIDFSFASIWLHSYLYCAENCMCGGSRKASDSQKEKNGKKEREEPNKRNVHYPYLSFACRKKKMSRRPTVIQSFFFLRFYASFLNAF